MKSHLRLLACVLEDSRIWCCTSTTRDLETITRRVEREGFSFLTITLPSFCSDFERCLADGFVAPDSFQGFHRPKGMAIPAFLQGMLERVFDSKCGGLLDNPCIHAIACIRQICQMHKKVLLPCSSERKERAYDGYIECENDIKLAVLGITDTDIERFREVSRVLWGSSLQKVNLLVGSQKLIPRHGPGATAERISGNQKYRLAVWTERLQPFFPADQYAIPNLGFADRLAQLDFVEPGRELPVRVIQVPKTLKTPRIIAIEPVCMQYTQQALLHPIVEALETHPLTKGKVNFTNQTVNRDLALSSSRDGRLATLDMKEASDRVSVALVGDMLHMLPDLRDAIFACRSTKADLPGRGIITLAKFASMGSALCFPIEAMVFYTIILMTILESQGLRVSQRSLMRASRDVRVYGDDIIVPVALVPLVCSKLEAFGLRVNYRKSFWTGKFRESCGMDAYDGIPVTPAYCRRMLPASKRDAQEILSAIALGNQLYEKGFWVTAQYVRDSVERVGIPLPRVADTSPIHGRLSYLGYDSFRTCKYLHRDLVFGVVPRVAPQPDVLDDMGALMKCFLKPGSEPFQDKQHLERHGRPLAVNIKLGWFPSY